MLEKCDVVLVEAKNGPSSWRGHGYPATTFTENTAGSQHIFCRRFRSPFSDRQRF